MDLIAGFHADPLRLLMDGNTHVVIDSQPPAKRGLHVARPFRFEILAVVSNEHRLRSERRVSAENLRGQFLSQQSDVVTLEEANVPTVHLRLLIHGGFMTPPTIVNMVPGAI